jgi:hypothetical protein
MARRRKITDQFPGSLRAALRRRGIRMVRPRAQKTRTSGAQLALVGVRGAGLTPFSGSGALSMIDPQDPLSTSTERFR